MALMDARMCVRNEFFMEDLAGAGLTKDQKLLMVCQEGLRSKMAADEVSKRGYNDVSYMLGGFSADIDGDFPVEGEYLLKNAAKGGAGRYLTPATVVGIASIFAAVFAGTVYAPEEAARVAVFLGL